jgi:Tol biopolymer transport system component
MDRSRIGLAILFRHSAVRVISGFIGLFFGLAGVVRVADAQQATTQLVSVSSAGDQGDSTSNRPDISGDGRLVVFQSAASNLVPEDQNDASDVFVRDLVAGITRRISVSSAGVEGDLDSESPAISGDGRFVSFVSVATNLVAGDTNNTADVFVHDRLTGETNRVSVTSTGEEANAISWGARLSYDGRYVLFLSDASNLAPDDANGVMTDLFVHDRLTGETSRLPLGPEGVGPDDLIRGGSLSDSGRWVAFQSDAANLSNSTGECKFIWRTGNFGKRQGHYLRGWKIRGLRVGRCQPGAQRHE